MSRIAIGRLCVAGLAAALVAECPAAPLISVVGSTSTGGLPLFTFFVDPADLTGGFNTISLDPAFGIDGIVPDSASGFNQVGFPGATTTPGGNDSGLLAGPSGTVFPLADTRDLLTGGIVVLGTTNAISAGTRPFAQVVFASGAVASGRYEVGFRDASRTVAVVSGRFGAAPPIDADFNSDGRVDAADYTVWRDRFGTQVSPGAPGDADSDGEIDRTDYDLWSGLFGTVTTSSAGGVAAVPEPSALVLACCLAGTALPRRSGSAAACAAVC